MQFPLDKMVRKMSVSSGTREITTLDARCAECRMGGEASETDAGVMATSVLVGARDPRTKRDRGVSSWWSRRCVVVVMGDDTENTTQR